MGKKLEQSFEIISLKPDDQWEGMIWDDFGLHFLLSKLDWFSAGWECKHSLVLVEEQDNKDCQVVRMSEYDCEFGAAPIFIFCIYMYIEICT